MPAIDFKEIPQANLATGEQDAFELFARDFLETLGYEILSGPNRGPDGGKDLIVLETRIGIGGKTFLKWLVSCKHYAPTGQSVSASDEERITDRVKQHGCNGFLGFYSTLPAASLTNALEGIKENSPPFEFQIFDKGKIESHMLASPEFQAIISNYFPRSFESQRLSNIGLNIAMSRFGMPQPILYKFPNEDKTLTLDEVIELYPQGNQYAWKMFSADFIFFNNILGITKIMRGGERIDPTLNDLEEHRNNMSRALESVKEEFKEEHEKSKREYLESEKDI